MIPKMFTFHDLDGTTREYMLQELDGDVRSSRLYLSRRLSPLGRNFYADHLRDAITSGDARSLGVALGAPGLLNAVETTRQGERKMASNAHALLAEGEFNRFYVRGVCARALAEGSGTVTVYRAKESGWHRPESDAQVGNVLGAGELLDTLRANTLNPENVSIPDVNSGLSVRI